MKKLHIALILAINFSFMIGFCNASILSKGLLEAAYNGKSYSDSVLKTQYDSNSSTSYICEKGGYSCSSSNSIFKLKNNSNAAYICPGDDLSCGSSNAIFKISNGYVCLASSFGCSSSSALSYPIIPIEDIVKLIDGGKSSSVSIKHDGDNYYVCNSSYCSFSSAFLTVKQNGDNFNMCVGGSYSCYNSDAFIKMKRDSSYYYICGPDSYSCSSSSSFMKVRRTSSSTSSRPCGGDCSICQMQIEYYENMIDQLQQQAAGAAAGIESKMSAQGLSASAIASSQAGVSSSYNSQILDIQSKLIAAKQEYAECKAYSSMDSYDYSSTKLKGDALCREEYGSYSIATSNNYCTCKKGYVWNEDGTRCISLDDSCKESFGLNSKSVGNGQCNCKDGYVWNVAGTRCISEEDRCHEVFGKNSKFVGDGLCNCKDGYQWNDEQTKCVSTSSVCSNLYGKYSTAGEEYGTCVCMDGYDWNKAGNECISKSSNKSCQDWYGENSIVGDGGCVCKNGYVWNYDQTSCVIQNNNVENNTINIQTSTNNQNSNVYNNGFSDEYNRAYEFAYANKITTMSTIEQANMNSPIVRAEIAKMIANWMKSLGFSPDTSKSCSFNDISSIKGDLYPAIIESCQLGVMGQGINDFRPFDTITRGEVSTVISRILWGSKYEGGDPFYRNHMNALKNIGVLDNLNNPDENELRGNVMVMLMRASDAGVIVDCEDPAIMLACEVSPSDCPKECLIKDEEANLSNDVIDYNDIIIDYIWNCDDSSVNNLLDQEPLDYKALEKATRNTLSLCKKSYLELKNLGDWEGDDTFISDAIKFVTVKSAFYKVFEEIIPYMGRELTDTESEEYTKLSDELNKLDKMLSESDSNLNTTQKEFANKFGYTLDE